MFNQNVKRFLGNKNNEYVVVALMIMEDEIDSFTGKQVLNITYRYGDVNQPVNFIPFFQRIQDEQQTP